MFKIKVDFRLDRDYLNFKSSVYLQNSYCVDKISSGMFFSLILEVFCSKGSANNLLFCLFRTLSNHSSQYQNHRDSKEFWIRANFYENCHKNIKHYQVVVCHVYTPIHMIWTEATYLLYIGHSTCSCLAENNSIHCSSKPKIESLSRNAENIFLNGHTKSQIELITIPIVTLMSVLKIN